VRGARARRRSSRTLPVAVAGGVDSTCAIARMA
jgi:hypothetical protein